MRVACANPERCHERIRLTRRNRGDVCHCRAQQLLQRGERKLRFRLNPPRPQDVHALSPLGDILKES